MLNNSLIFMAKHAKSRMKAKTPSWFQFVRNSGLILSGISTIIITAPVVLPAIVVTVGGYCAMAGAVAALVAQTAVDNE